MIRPELHDDARGAAGPFAVVLLIIAVAGIVAVGWRVNESVGKTEEANANASVVGATLQIYQNENISAVTKWIEYRNDKLGFSFKFPPAWGNARVASDTDDLFLLLFDNPAEGKPKHFKGELRATSTTAPFTDNAVARGYTNVNGIYYRRFDNQPKLDITDQVLVVLDTKAGSAVLYKDTANSAADPALTALLNLNHSSSFSGLNFTYGDDYTNDDIASFKKVLQTFTYTN